MIAFSLKWIFISDNLDTNALKSRKSVKLYTFNRVFKSNYINTNDSEVDFCKVKKSTTLYPFKEDAQETILYNFHCHI